jgi:Na+:H+ antiporter, NhaA family
MRSSTDGVPGSLVGERGSDVNERPGARQNPEIKDPWSRSDRPVPRRLLRPLQEFLETSTASGVVLLGAVVVALAWVNSPWDRAYLSLLATPISVGVGDLVVSGDLHLWINEGLMALFFLVVGLEIKRELTTGELRRPRAALLPVIAAATGMAVPALLFVAVVGDGTGARGWGIPMATDVAFALGVLALAAARTPSGLRPLLLAIAIVDDIGSVAVVAAFYPGAIAVGWLTLSVAVAGLVYVFPKIHIRATAVYVTLGIALWYAMYRSGLHPALAGAVVGLLTPSEPFQRPHAVSQEAHRTAERTEDDPSPPDADASEWLRLAELSREAVSPLTRIEHVLLPWTSFVVLPVFALANAGVRLSASSIAAAAGSAVAWAVLIARVGGKIAGIWGGAALASRLGLVDLPSGVRSVHLAGMAASAGTGFTVSLFVAEVAFGRDSPLLAPVKISLLAASIVSAIVALLLFRQARSSSGEAGAGAPPSAASGPATKAT